MKILPQLDFYKTSSKLETYEFGLIKNFFIYLYYDALSIDQAELSYPKWLFFF